MKMKGLTGRQRMLINRKGLVLVVQPRVTTYGTQVMFEKTFPECDQRVFATIVDRCNKEEAYKLKTKEFINWTRRALIDVAQGFNQDTVIGVDDSFAVVYNYIADFLKRRDELIKSY